MAPAFVFCHLQTNFFHRFKKDNQRKQKHYMTGKSSGIGAGIILFHGLGYGCLWFISTPPPT